jgi:hypothetical protein
MVLHSFHRFGGCDYLYVICLTFIRTKQEYASDVLVEHNFQVEIIFPLKQGGNIYVLGVEIAS